MELTSFKVVMILCAPVTACWKRCAGKSSFLARKCLLKVKKNLVFASAFETNHVLHENKSDWFFQ